ncbi:MAG: glycogen-debranching protein, partial [Vicinamibacterales bacterium]
YEGLASDAAIESLVSLGVTAVELMPVHQFAHDSHLVEQGLRNYWGYNTYGFFAPHAEYAASRTPGGQVAEFKSLVKRLHNAGLLVYLDVVYNHTAEGNHLGPTLCFKGFDNPAYYHLVSDDPRYYMDYTGTGNSMNLRHPYSLQLVMDSLRYWTSEMHVDGFRFDLAATLARGRHTVDTWSAFFATIHQDPVLQHTTLIAEPWDTGDNGYQVGNFPFRWAEWNDKYRETVRAFWREDRRDLSDLARRLTGSADLFQQEGRRPWASINYVASHDGLTLRDLVATAPTVEAARAAGGDAAGTACAIQRGLIATLLLSMGVPMLTAGDEAGRTQGGDHNAYCQDNEISWIDWEGADDGLRAFTRTLIALRPAIPWLQSTTWPGGALSVRWVWPDGREPTPEDWAEPRTDLGMLGDRNGATALLILNAGSAPVTYTLPPVAPAVWRPVLLSRCDQGTPRNGAVAAAAFEVPSFSVAVLIKGRA